jgi:hypothetical protein
MSADNLRAAVVDEIDEVGGGQTIVDRDQHRANLRHRIERFQLGVSVGRDVGDAIALLDTKSLEHRRPAIAAIEKLFVGQTQVTVDHCFALTIELAGTTREFDWRQRRFH